MRFTTKRVILITLLMLPPISIATAEEASFKPIPHDIAANANTQRSVSCEEARTNIINNFGDKRGTLGDFQYSPEDIGELIGRPLKTRTSSWSYGRSLKNTRIFFSGSKPRHETGAQRHRNILPEYALWATTQPCDITDSDSDSHILSEANRLLATGPVEDFTGKEPSCVDAGIRMQAFMKQGMSPEDVESLIGKRITTRGKDSVWIYSTNRQGTPSVYFIGDRENGVFEPHFLVGWGSDISGC